MVRDRERARPAPRTEAPRRPLRSAVAEAAVGLILLLGVAKVLWPGGPAAPARAGEPSLAERVAALEERAAELEERLDLLGVCFETGVVVIPGERHDEDPRIEFACIAGASGSFTGGPGGGGPAGGER